MKKTLMIVAVLALTGCNKKHALIGVTETKSSLTVMIAGQSNAVSLSPDGEMGFSQVINNREITFINCAVNGSSIAQWDPNGPFMDGCVAKAQQNGHRIDVLLWYQGETDAELGTVNYAMKFMGVMREFQRQFGEDIKISYAQLAITTRPDFLLHWDEIKQEQASCQGNGMVMIYTGDLKLGDTVHLDSPSRTEVGRRFARALAEVL